MGVGGGAGVVLEAMLTPASDRQIFAISFSARVGQDERGRGQTLKTHLMQ